MRSKNKFKMNINSNYFYPIIFLIGILVAFVLHISIGTKTIPIQTVFDAIFSFQDTVFDHIVIVDLRLPRAIFAILVGAALSVSGSLMQGVTRNMLASPSILGVSAGASFAVVMAVGFFEIVPAGLIAPTAALGATATSALVWIIATLAPGGATPIVLVLAGSVIGAFLGAFITIVNLLDSTSFENLRTWLSGSLSTQNIDVLYWTLPWLLIGFVIAFGVAKQVTALAMGNETAIGLGVNAKKIRSLAILAAIILTSSSVSLAGPLGFIGLVIPHIVRLLVGSDYRKIVPYSAFLGATYLLLVDIFSRIIFAPYEMSTGIMTAIIGAPVFIWLIRTRL